MVVRWNYLLLLALHSKNMVVVRSSNLASNASLYADVTRQEIINQSLQVQSLIQVWHNFFFAIINIYCGSLNSKFN